MDMTTDERIGQLEIKVKRLTSVRREMDREERRRESRNRPQPRKMRLYEMVRKIAEKLNALIAIVDGMIQGPKR